MTLPIWPWRLLTPQDEVWCRKGTVVEGGPSISGVQQVIKTDGGGWWQATLSGFQLFTPDQVKAWRAWEAMLDDGVTSVIVPKPDLNLAPRPYAGAELMKPGCPAPAAPGDWFNWDPGLGSKMIDAVNVGAAALRATSIVIQMNRGQPPEAGQFFSIDHATSGWRLYVIQQVTAVVGDQYTVTIRPPLRDVIADAAAVEFDTPRCTMRLDPGSAEKAAAKVVLGRAAQGAIVFKEAF